MDTPQLENGYIRIATEIFEALARYRIPGEQRQVLDVIIRKTYGFNKIWDMISNSQFVKATGLAKPSVCRAINGLVDKGLVYKNANNYIPSYRFNKNYKTWKVLTKKLTVNKKVNRVLTKKLPTINNTTIDNISKRFKFKKKVPIPKDFCLIPEMVTYAKKIKYNGCLKSFTEHMILSAKSNGYKYNDWTATWKNWLRRDIEKHPEHQDKEKKYVGF